ncbi:MAG: hypothetical protein HN522_01930 [Flavobacteriales bacterium]|jgi:hypothetical protein|nr:hypothetical protein [Flavobacteriales bacterium]MBT5750087.1 hypothetical protein [Flavobacteriales bacterium]
MKNYFFIILFYSIFLSSCLQKKKFELQEGDLLFQDLDSSPLCDAIELVTPGYNGANFSHIGLIVSDNDTLKILEAIPPKVVLTDMKSFFNRSYDTEGRSKIIAGRLKDEFQHTIKDAIIYAKNKIGIKYDEVFLMNNNSYYCSELIFEAFEKDSIFTLKPMTFLHPETNDTLTVWKNYYSKLGIKIPQNEPGINPGIMSLSDKIGIIYSYGIPDGMEQ